MSSCRIDSLSLLESWYLYGLACGKSRLQAYFFQDRHAEKAPVAVSADAHRAESAHNG
jgi:hypothetical protein